MTNDKRRITTLLTTGLTVLLSQGSMAQTPDPFAELDNFEYWADLCDIAATATDYETALSACEQAILLDPRNAGVWTDRSYILLQLQQYPDAIASTRVALNLETDASVAYTWQCGAFLGLERYEDAIDACETALTLDSRWEMTNPAQAWTWRGLALNGLKDDEAALISFQRASLVKPESSALFAYQCEALLNLNRPLEAIAQCDQAIALNENWSNLDPSQALANRGLALERLGGNESAIAAYDRSLETLPQNAQVWTQQGLLFAAQENYIEALNSYTQALNIQPDYSLALVKQCETLNKLERYDAALAACQSALQGDRTWDRWGIAEAWNQIAIAQTNLGQREEALVAANRAVGFQPTYAEAWNNRGVPLWYLERYEDSLASYNRALEIQPNYAQAWLNKAKVLQSLERYGQARLAYEEALQIDPENATAWANYSHLLIYLDDLDTALTASQQALDLDPELISALLARGKALITLQQYRDAIAIYQLITNLDPDNATAWGQLALAFTQLGRSEEAQIALGRYQLLQGVED